MYTPIKDVHDLDDEFFLGAPNIPHLKRPLVTRQEQHDIAVTQIALAE